MLSATESPRPSAVVPYSLDRAANLLASRSAASPAHPNPQYESGNTENPGLHLSYERTPATFPPASAQTTVAPPPVVPGFHPGNPASSSRALRRSAQPDKPSCQPEIAGCREWRCPVRPWSEDSVLSRPSTNLRCKSCAQAR